VHSSNPTTAPTTDAKTGPEYGAADPACATTKATHVPLFSCKPGPHRAVWLCVSVAVTEGLSVGELDGVMVPDCEGVAERL